jgi:hypothetical protein
MNGRPIGVFATLLFITTVTLAQQSASYKLAEHTFNAASHPSGGTVLGSASYRVRLDAIGDAVAGMSLASASFRADGGFVARYPAPTEVAGLRFVNKTSLAWNAERSAGVYNLYRDVVSTLPVSFGACWQTSIPGTSTSDAEVPSIGTALFYLVTAENRLGEEGTKGYSSSGAQRPNSAPCP